MWGSSKASFNPLRDSMFTGNEDLCYELEMLATLIASAGTTTFRSINMESEVNAAKMAGYEKNIIFESGKKTVVVNGKTVTMCILIQDNIPLRLIEVSLTSGKENIGSGEVSI